MLWLAMEPPKRFRIPTLDEMENADKNKEPDLLFQQKKKISESSSATTFKSTDAITISNLIKVAKTVQNNAENSTEQNVNNKSSESYISSGISKRHCSDSITNERETSSSVNGNEADSTKSDSSNRLTDIPKGPTIGARPGSTNSLIVNTRQRGNPILKSVRNVPWEYGNIIPDYVMGQSTCALFLSLRYHQLHPNYIHERLQLLGKSYELRVLLVQVDVKEPHHILKDLAKMCLLADCTLILAFSQEEAGRYLETYKIFENKPPEAIMEKTEDNFMAKNLTNIMEASEEDLSLCPGFGPQKAKRLHSIFHEPFLRSGHIGKH